MAIDNRTPGFNLPLPHESNRLEEDVLRLREAIAALDTTLAAIRDNGASTVETLVTAQQIAEAVAGLRILMASDDAGLATLQALVNAVKLRAPLLSPSFTGLPSAPKPPTDDDSGRLATTSFVLGQGSDAAPAQAGTPSAGTAKKWARGDHRHPVDPTRAPVNSPTLTGTPKAPTPALGAEGVRIATVASVIAEILDAFTGAGRSRMQPDWGWQYFPGGRLLQWVQIAMPTNTSQIFTWPEAFYNGAMAVLATKGHAISTGDSSIGASMVLGSEESQFVVTNANPSGPAQGVTVWGFGY